MSEVPSRCFEATGVQFPDVAERFPSNSTAQKTIYAVEPLPLAFLGPGNLHQEILAQKLEGHEFN